MSGATAATRISSGRVSLAAFYRLLFRLQVTLPRVVGILALGLLGVLLGALARGDDDVLRAAATFIATFGFGLLLPLSTAWLATSTIGDLIEDRLLVYLWLKPVPRWQLPAAALLATVTVVVPLVGIPLVATAVAAGTTELVGAIALASLLGAFAYAGIFVAAGLWLRRALWWALLYILVWENGLARSVNGVARFSIASYPQSLVADAASIDLSYANRTPAASVIVPVVVGLVGFALAVSRYRRAEVD